MTEQELDDLQPELINEPVEAATEKAQGYALDVPYYEVCIDVSPDTKKEKLVEARITPATAGQEINRENSSTTAYREASAYEETLLIKDEAANSHLFDETCTHVKGFRLLKESYDAAKEWREATPEILAFIPDTFKAAFLSATRNAKAEFVDNSDGGFVLGGNQVLEVKVSFPLSDGGTSPVFFQFPEPSHDELDEYNERVSELRQSRGESKRTTRVLSNIKEALSFFDSLLMRPEGNIIGATVGGITFPTGVAKLARLAFICKIEPALKVKVLSVAMRKYSARQSD